MEQQKTKRVYKDEKEKVTGVDVHHYLIVVLGAMGFAWMFYANQVCTACKAVEDKFYYVFGVMMLLGKGAIDLGKQFIATKTGTTLKEDK